MGGKEKVLSQASQESLLRIFLSYLDLCNVLFPFAY